MANKKVLIIPAIYEGSRDLKDRTKKLTFQTNEVAPVIAANLQEFIQNFVYLGIKSENFTKAEIDKFNSLSAEYEDTTKSPSQRLRAVFYRCWEQSHEGYKDFNLYYNFKMEGVISHFKSKLI